MLRNICSIRDPSPRDFSIMTLVAGFVASLSKLMPRAYSIASVEPKFTLVGGQNIPVTDLVLEVMEFETGPFLAEETEPKMRKGVASNFLTRLPIGKLKYSHVFSKINCFRIL